MNVCLDLSHEPQTMRTRVSPLRGPMSLPHLLDCCPNLTPNPCHSQGMEAGVCVCVHACMYLEIYAHSTNSTRDTSLFLFLALIQFKRG